MSSFDAVFQGASDPGKIGMEAFTMTSQKLLKRSVNVILPVMLLLCGLGTIIYRVTSTSYDSADPVKTFLVLAVLQLLPMAALKIKTLVCSDLVRLMPVALTKTLMMHIAVQLFRLTFHIIRMDDQYTALNAVCFDCISLVVAVIILFREFHFKLGSLLSKEHSDVLTTVASGCLMALVMNVIAPPDGRSVRLLWVLNDFGNYMEVFAFVPVARILCLEIGVEECGTNVRECDRRKLKIFMSFILAFYFWDDIGFVFLSSTDVPIVAAAKAAHFVMLVDFAGYFVLQAHAQPKVVNDILPKVLPDAILQEVVPKHDPEMGYQTEETKGLLGTEDDDSWD